MVSKDADRLIAAGRRVGVDTAPPRPCAAAAAAEGPTAAEAGVDVPLGGGGLRDAGAAPTRTTHAALSSPTQRFTQTNAVFPSAYDGVQYSYVSKQVIEFIQRFQEQCLQSAAKLLYTV